MRSISRKEINPIKMSVNPPIEIVNYGYRVINNEDGKIYTYVGIGWTVGEKAKKEDFLNIPQLIG